jgi:hypothetical protein
LQVKKAAVFGIYSQRSNLENALNGVEFPADRMRDPPDAVPLRTSLRQGNGKNLNRITVPPNLTED